MKARHERSKEKQGGGGIKKKEEGKKGGGAADCVFFYLSIQFYFNLGFLCECSFILQIKFLSFLILFSSDWILLSVVGAKAFPSLVPQGPGVVGGRAHPVTSSIIKKL